MAAFCALNGVHIDLERLFDADPAYLLWVQVVVERVEQGIIARAEREKLEWSQNG